MDRKVVGFGMAILCGALAFYMADRAAMRPGGEWGALGITFAVLTVIFVALAFSEGYEGYGGDRHVTTHVVNNITVPQVQYVPVLQEAPPPQIVYVEREAPAPVGVTAVEVARIVAEAMARQPLPPPQQSVLLAPPAHRPMEIEAEYRTLRPLPSPKAQPDQPLRLSGPKKSIAGRVAVALLNNPKAKVKVKT